MLIPDNEYLGSPYGDYIVANDVNPKLYAGETIRGFRKRWQQHLRDVRHGSQCYFHKGIRKHGPDNFNLAAWIGLGKEFLEEHALDPDTEVQKIEVMLIDRLGLTNPEKGYNLTTGGEGGRPNESARRKMSDSSSRAWMNPKRHAAMSAVHKGKAKSFEQRENMSKAATKRWATLGTEQKNKLNCPSNCHLCTSGLCHCECGRLAPIALRTDRKMGWVKGQPKRFINGHSGAKARRGKGKPLSPGQRAKLRAAALVREERRRLHRAGLSV